MKELVLSVSQERLLEAVKAWHGSQVRKYTGEPYWNHPLSVARIVNHHDGSDLAVEIALCHDLFEDTSCSDLILLTILMFIGYSVSDSYKIVKGVTELSDVWTSERFPTMNRKTRKLLEVTRLSTISSISQSVKLADMIDNASSIIEHDPSFAKIYLEEKMLIFQNMKGGSEEMRKAFLASLDAAKQKLKENQQ